MFPKYVWLLLLLSVFYMLFSSNYYTNIEKYLKNYYENILNFHKSTPMHASNDNNEILFTTSVLKKYTTLNDGLYLSILGQVFDVTSGAKHYGPGESYHVFTGIISKFILYFIR